MMDVTEDSLSKMMCCPRCDGLKQVQIDKDTSRECPVCKGVGEIRVPGDADARNLLFEAMKLTGRGAVTVAIQQNFGQGSLEEELQLTQKIVMGETK